MAKWHEIYRWYKIIKDIKKIIDYIPITTINNRKYVDNYNHVMKRYREVMSTKLDDLS